MILACITATLINVSGFDFTTRDMGTLLRAQDVCADMNGRCLKSLKKTKKHSFHVICGDKMRFDKQLHDEMVIETIHYELRHLDPVQKRKALEKIGL